MPKPPLQNTLTHFLDTRPGSELEDARLLPLDLIDPNPAQSRQVFDEAALIELATSIQAQGVLQPILVRLVGDRYQVVAGERRVRAARRAGLAEIPALIRELSEAEAAYATTVENLQREDLDLEDEARYLAYLQQLTGLSGRALAAQLGKSHNYVADRLLLAERSDLLAAYRAGTLTLVQAVAAARIPAPPAPPVLAKDTPIPASYDEPGVLAKDTPIATSQNMADPPPQPVERAALDQADGAGDTRRIPYRARALDAAATTFLRTDWATVPVRERATVREQLLLIEETARKAREALGD